MLDLRWGLMTTGITPIQKAIIYLVTFYRVASFPSGLFFFAVTDISNKLGLSPPPDPLLAFECHETKSCEIKPAVRAMKMGS